LQRFNVEFNILTVVSQANVRHARDVYQYLVEQGFYYHQYITCIEFDENGKPLPYSITGPEWGQFLLELFDAWYPNDIYKVSVRHFDDILNKLYDDSIKVQHLICSTLKRLLLLHELTPHFFPENPPERFLPFYPRFCQAPRHTWLLPGHPHFLQMRGSNHQYT